MYYRLTVPPSIISAIPSEPSPRNLAHQQVQLRIHAPSQAGRVELDAHVERAAQAHAAFAPLPGHDGGHGDAHFTSHALSVANLVQLGRPRHDVGRRAPAEDLTALADLWRAEGDGDHLLLGADARGRLPTKRMSLMR